jgi:DNA-binding protein YbaB
MSESADILLRRIEAIDTVAAENRLRAESYRRMAEELKEVKASATSDNGIVTVVAGPGGEVKAITFTDRVRNTAPAALSATVLHTIAKARANAARMQAEVVRGTLGDTELLERVLDADERMFGDERPRDPGPSPARAQRPVPENHDDAEGQFSVFKNGPAW